jgi:hypothetical protein
MLKIYRIIIYGLTIAASLSNLTFAQSVKVVNGGAKIVISSSTVVRTDDYINSTVGGTDGTITNSGSMELTGNWTNNATGGGSVFTSNAGDVVFNGSSLQTVGGATETKFNNVILESSSSGLLLNTNTTIGGGFLNPLGVLTFNNNIVNLNSNVLTITNPNPNAINVASSGFIRSETTPSSGYGIVKWNIGTNTGNFVVPFGTATNSDIQFQYNVDNVAGVGNGYIEFATYPTSGGNTPFATGVTHITNDLGIDNSAKVYDRFWIVSPQGYTTNPQGKYVFKYLASEIDGATEANLRAQRFNTALNKWGDWLYSPSPNLGSKTVTLDIANPLDYFDTWTLADNSNPLPIELVRFSGECDGNVVNLSWTTASEVNVSHYEVERTIDGEHFDKVAEVVAVGFSNNLHSYDAKDEHPYAGTAYYRLKSVDLDGSFEYSDLIATGCQNNDNVAFSFQNAYPTEEGNLNLVYTAEQNESFDASLFDMSGKLIASTNGIAGVKGNNQSKMFIGDLAPGIYVVNMLNGDRIFSKKIFIN